MVRRCICSISIQFFQKPQVEPHFLCTICNQLNSAVPPNQLTADLQDTEALVDDTVPDDIAANEGEDENVNAAIGVVNDMFIPNNGGDEEIVHGAIEDGLMPHLSIFGEAPSGADEFLEVLPPNSFVANREDDEIVTAPLDDVMRLVLPSLGVGCTPVDDVDNDLLGDDIVSSGVDEEVVPPGVDDVDTDLLRDDLLSNGIDEEVVPPGIVDVMINGLPVLKVHGAVMDETPVIPVPVLPDPEVGEFSSAIMNSL